jgi:signal transduction histidine kinase
MVGLLTSTEEAAPTGTKRHNVHPTSSNSPRVAHRAWLGAAAPIVGLVLVVIGLAFTVVAGFARQQDGDFVQASRRLVESALQARTRAVSNMAIDYGVWDDAYQAITANWDQDWLENTYYSSIADGVAVVRADGQVRYLWLAEDFEPNRQAIEVEAARALTSEFNLQALAAQPNTNARVASTLINVGDHLVLVALAPISMDNALPRDTSRPADYVATIDVLDSDELAEIGSDLHVQGFRFVPEPGPAAERDRNEVTLLVSTTTGRGVGHFTWRRERPGSEGFLGQIWPIVACLLLVGALTVLVARRLVDVQVQAMADAKGATEASRLKSEFIATMSHELRTPLNAIVGYTELIQEQIEPFGPTGETIHEDAQRVLVAAKHLGQLVNDILDQSRIDAGRLKITLEPLAVRDLLVELEELVHPIARANKNVFSIAVADDVEAVRGDQVRVLQCLLNLTANALKFTHGGTVTILAKQRQTRDGLEVMFDVADTGIGIEKADLDRLFKPFGQANATIESKFGGTGLGLSITRSLARAMGGDVVVQSQLGVGSTFTLSLPASQFEAQQLV